MATVTKAASGTLTTSYASLLTVGSTKHVVGMQVEFINTSASAVMIHAQLNLTGSDEQWFALTLEGKTGSYESGGRKVETLLGLPSDGILKAKADTNSVIQYKVIYGERDN